MKVAFRVDASIAIGSGHVMRCLTLADQLAGRGTEVSFVCREHQGELCQLPAARGYAVARLPEAACDFLPRADDLPHAPWLGATWEEDAAQTVAALGARRPDWLVVDHYAIDRRWERRLRPCAARIMVIDDLADRPHDCDLLLDQNLYRDLESRYHALLPADCRQLLGPKYALLRPEFAAARQTLRQRQGVVERVLVSFGGVDASGETVKALQALAGIPGRRFAVDVVAGGGNPRQAEIRDFCLGHAGFHYHCQVDNMAQLMEAADLAIGAGGSTTWERCALGLPALVVTLAENQLQLARDAAERGLLIHLGAKEAFTAGYLQESLNTFCSLPATLRLLSDNGRAAVDARGALRVAGALMPPHILVRRAEAKDCDSLFAWRNDEATRKFIFDQAAIAMETHRSWFAKTLLNPDRILLIGEVAGRPVGVLRYDVCGGEALISVYLVPGGQGQGVGSELIRCGSRWLKEHRPEVKAVNAEIMRVNVASLLAFQQAGYHEHHVTYQEVLS